MRHVKIAPSILTADFTRLGEQVSEAIAAGVEYLQVDVMDGHFVPNLTFGPLVVASLKRLCQPAGVVLDVHLMIERPERFLAEFASAGADLLTVHVEATSHVHQAIQHIHWLGLRAGVALNPATPLSALEELLPVVDLVLVMSVNPGFGSQVYIPSSTEKIRRLRAMLNERRLENVEIEVDGGVKADNIQEVAAAGATVVVVGSAVYNSYASVSDNIAALRRAIANGPS